MTRQQNGRFAKKETAESLRARYIATFAERKALEVTIAARQNDVAMIEKEQEELREKVRALGFDFYDAQKLEEDMRDPKNWRVGDKFVLNESWCEEVEKLEGKIVTASNLFTRPDGIALEVFELGPKFQGLSNKFKFHSRPK